MKIIQILKNICLLLLLTSNSLITSYQIKESIKSKASRKIMDIKTISRRSLRVAKYVEDTINRIEEHLKTYPDPKSMNKLRLIIERTIESSKLWEKDDERRKILDKIKKSEANGLYQLILLNPNFKKISANLATLEQIDELISKFSALKEKYPELKKTCDKWMSICQEKKDNIQELKNKAVKNDSSSDIKAAIDNAVKGNDVISVVSKVSEKINLACKKAIADATPPKFCWRQGGTASPRCGKNQIEHTYGLCYDKCKEGFEYDFSMCKLICDSDEYSLALHCAKSLFSWRSREAYTPESRTMFSDEVKCPKDLPEHIGALCYRKCPPGTSNCGCCACSIDTATCSSEIVNMVVTIAKGLVKLISFALTAGGSSAIVEGYQKTVDIVFAVVDAITAELTKIAETMSNAYKSFTSETSEDKALISYKNFVKNIAYKKYLQPDLDDSDKEDKKIKKDLYTECDKQSSNNWELWKNVYQLTKQKTNINSSEFKKVLIDTYVKAGTTAIGFLDVLKSSSSNEVMNKMKESSEKGEKISNTLVGLHEMIKQVIEKKNNFSENDGIDTAKSVLSIMEIWDPTGITTIANAVMQPVCNDDPIYVEEVEILNRRKRK